MASIAASYQPRSQSEFEANLVYKIEDLDWLAETSVVHQRIISAIAAETEILPARLGSIFPTENSLSRHVLRRLPELKSDLVRIRGADQWGVDVFEVQPMGAPFAKIRKGKNDLRAKRPRSRARRQRSGDMGAIKKKLNGRFKVSRPKFGQPKKVS